MCEDAVGSLEHAGGMERERFIPVLKKRTSRFSTCLTSVLPLIITMIINKSFLGFDECRTG